ncbi:hypothetical protein ACVI1L_000148 [Bradyrhizobium sp. USDA 4516]
MNRPQTGRASFEARKGAHLRMTVELVQLDHASV